MKNNDKVLVAFLVTLGLFSTVQATQYVNSLSSQDKAVLQATAEDSTGAVENPPNRVYPEN